MIYFMDRMSIDGRIMPEKRSRVDSLEFYVHQLQTSTHPIATKDAIIS